MVLLELWSLSWVQGFQNIRKQRFQVYWKKNFDYFAELFILHYIFGTQVLKVSLSILSKYFDAFVPLVIKCYLITWICSPYEFCNEKSQR